MIGIIGGTGLTQFSGLEILRKEWFNTPYGEASSAVSFGTLSGKQICFVARHGDPHSIAPHKVNYRANLSALKQAGVTDIFAVNAVGGIHKDLGPAQIACPDQIIDYTYDREHTIYDGGAQALQHVDFTYPYTEALRQKLLLASEDSNIAMLSQGVYGATQGPRLETAAEIKKFARDGCDMIGMTGMPEASLARELELNYACIALSVNWCAGMTESIITMDEIHEAIESGMGKVETLIRRVVDSY